MEYRPNDTPLWASTAGDCGEPADLPEPEDWPPPNVIIAVSLDDLDGLTGDLLV